MERSPYLSAASATCLAVFSASSGPISGLEAILERISSLISEISVESFMTPPSLVLKGFPSLPFIVPNPIWRSCVPSETRPHFLAVRKTCWKWSSWRLSVI